MKTTCRLLLFILTTAPIFSCHEDQAEISLNKTWKVIKFVDLITQTEIIKTQENSSGLDVIVTFNRSTFEGQNTTNSMWGTFTLNADKIDISGIISTEVAEPEWGQLFRQYFQGNMTYSLHSDQLILYNDPAREKAIVLFRQ